MNMPLDGNEVNFGVDGWYAGSREPSMLLSSAVGLAAFRFFCSAAHRPMIDGQPSFSNLQPHNLFLSLTEHSLTNCSGLF
jgi:hypothetical protein